VRKFVELGAFDRGRTLHFISFEAHPLSVADWQQVVHQRRTTLPIYEELGRKPIPHLKGWHRRTLLDGHVVLSLYYGDIHAGLAALSTQHAAPIDIWWLDGFAPARNPAMWDDGLFARIAQCSGSHATLATFTAAGRVRRGLADVGFAMRRVDQQPHKRESLAGRFTGAPRMAFQQPAEVAIEGAGIAGAWIAATLANHGIRVHVYDPLGPAAGASKMTATVLHGRLLGDGSPQASLRANAFHHAQAAYADLSSFSQSGVLQLSGPNLDARKMERIAARYHADAPDHGWLQRRNAGLWFPSAGIVDLPATVAALLDHPLIEFHQRTNDGRIETRVVCTGDAIREEWPWIESAEVYGQLDEYVWSDTPSADVPGYPVVGNGYFIPDPGQRGFTLGATFEYRPWDPSAATRRNEADNAHYLNSLDYRWVTRRRGARCVTSDRIPAVGQMADTTWVASAYGSMGTTFAPYLADLVASRLLGWMPTAAPNIVRLLEPARFKARQARRGVKHLPR
jgi:tRNA 5-methylaminomethyl-2-thiouridine biosynthesis bifunctional protein